MRKTDRLRAVFVLGLLASLLIGAVKAQYTQDGKAFPLASRISITSPSNCTYSSNRLTLNVTFKFLLGPSYSNLSYSIDEKNNVTLPLSATHEPVEATRTYENGTTEIVNSTFLVPFTITGEAALPELSEGTHNITVYAKYIANNIIGLDESTVCFTINANPEQTVPEFPSWTPLLSMLLAVMVFGLFTGKKLCVPKGERRLI